MGKRKRKRSDDDQQHNKELASSSTTPFDRIPCSSGMQLYKDSIGDAGNQEMSYCRPEIIIKSSSLAMDAVSPDMMKVNCGTCQMPLRWKPCILGNTTFSSSEPSVVAVLVCGHFYHADCLEQKTCAEDQRDPPCPLCLDLLSKTDDFGSRN